MRDRNKKTLDRDGRKAKKSALKQGSDLKGGGIADTNSKNGMKNRQAGQRRMVEELKKPILVIQVEEDSEGRKK